VLLIFSSEFAFAVFLFCSGPFIYVSQIIPQNFRADIWDKYWMHNYIASIRIKGNIVKTVVHAENSTHARLLLQYQYGLDCIVASPVLAETIKPKTPEQLRLDGLKANKERAADALAAERKRQKISNAQKALSVAQLPTLNRNH